MYSCFINGKLCRLSKFCSIDNTNKLKFHNLAMTTNVVVCRYLKLRIIKIFCLQGMTRTCPCSKLGGHFCMRTSIINLTSTMLLVTQDARGSSSWKLAQLWRMKRSPRHFLPSSRSRRMWLATQPSQCTIFQSDQSGRSLRINFVISKRLQQSCNVKIFEDLRCNSGIQYLAQKCDNLESYQHLEGTRINYCLH